MDQFSSRQDIKPSTQIECPKLSALELFSGLDSNEVLYLEHNILYYVREAIRMFMGEAKQSHALSTFIRRHNKRSFDSYVFKHDESVSSGDEARKNVQGKQLSREFCEELVSDELDDNS